MKVGFAGDIPNAAAEKESIVSQAAWASGIAFVLIIAGVGWFYRSPWSLVVIALPGDRSASAPPTRSRTSASAT